MDAFQLACPGMLDTTHGLPKPLPLYCYMYRLHMKVSLTFTAFKTNSIAQYHTARYLCLLIAVYVHHSNYYK